mmetsp:Transcript_28965/g.64282  ORF Transcript_28965/g.64282 Transcript_28965/m.64282 type:complete len:85 (+) Transcript_28965:1597-1851(+)
MANLSVLSLRGAGIVVAFLFVAHISASADNEPRRGDGDGDICIRLFCSAVRAENGCGEGGESRVSRSQSSACQGSRRKEEERKR